MSYVFQGQSYPHLDKMLDTIASEWLSAGGSASEEVQRTFLAESSDYEMTGECMLAWSLLQHAVDHGYEESDLAAAFGRLRTTLTAAKA